MAKTRRKRLWYCGLAGFVGLAALCGAQKPPAPPPAPAAAKAPAAASPLDEPLALIAKARASYDKVRDYSCTLIKREHVGGKLTPEHVIAMKVRTAPFSVSLRWAQPKELVGQEAVYVAGRNGGKMRAKSKGLLGAVGFVSVDPNDPRARATSRHSITEAGIGNLIARYERSWALEKKVGKTAVRVGVYEYAKRRCTRVETVQPAEGKRICEFYRSVVYFDQETALPIRVECYDWPRAKDDPGQLLAVYSYVNLRLNVGLGDEVFNK